MSKYTKYIIQKIKFNFQNTNLLMKQTINIDSNILIPKNFKEILNYKSPNLTIEEINYFDKYYKEFYIYKKLNKTIRKKLIKQDINAILELKLGKNIEKISFFLKNRSKKLKDIELIFIFSKFLEDSNFLNDFLKTNSDIYFETIKLIPIIYISNIYNLNKILKIYSSNLIKEKENITWNHFLLILSKEMHYIEHDGIIDTIIMQPILESFLIISEIDFNNDLTCNKKIEKIAKFIVKNINFLKFENILIFFECIMKNKIIQDLYFLEKFDVFFNENKEKFSFEQSVLILYYFTKQKFLSNNYIHNFYNLFYLINEINNENLCKLIWSLSQYNIKNKLFDDYFLELENKLIIKDLNKTNLSILIKSFDKSEKASKIFWSKFSIDLIKEKQLSFEICFCILKNLNNINIFDYDLLYYILSVFESKLKFDYMKELTLKEILTAFKIYSLNIIGFLKEKKEISIEIKNNYIVYFKLLVEKTINNIENLLIEENEDLMLLFQLLIISSNLIDKNNIYFFEKLEKYSKRTSKKTRIIEPLKQLKLIILIENFDIASKYYEKARNNFHLDFQENLSKSIEGIYCQLICLAYKYNLQNKKLWTIFQIKFIENHTNFNFQEFITIVLIFSKIEKEKKIEENKDFWILMQDNLNKFEDIENINMLHFLNELDLNNILKNSIIIEKSIENENKIQKEFYNKLFRKNSDKILIDISDIQEENQFNINQIKNLNNFLNFD